MHHQPLFIYYGFLLDIRILSAPPPTIRAVKGDSITLTVIVDDSIPDSELLYEVSFTTHVLVATSALSFFGY
jgi:hypothetical protein